MIASQCTVYTWFTRTSQKDRSSESSVDVFQPLAHLSGSHLLSRYLACFHWRNPLPKLLLPP